MDKTADYWDAYYADKEKPAVPSQFASFILNEFRHKSRFVDIGCGDGRDSMFFAHFNKSVLGIDGSTSAVEMCRATAGRRDLSNASFKTLDMNNAALCEQFLEEYATGWTEAIIYARFFLHAIDEKAQDNFLKLAAALVGKDGHVCIEFRTPRDEFQTKVTSAHYRRYVDPLDLAENARAHGLSCIYSVEGFGFAKYRSDDAYVARMIMAKT
ncbi:MAG: class I SAM-dependent methyltransferase [Pseudomonadota bacterium]